MKNKDLEFNKNKIFENIDKIIEKIGKLVVEVQQHHQASFVFVIGHFINLFGSVIVQSNQNIQFQHLPIKFTTNCFVFFKNILDCDLYYATNNETNSNQSNQSNNNLNNPNFNPNVNEILKHNYLSVDFLHNFCCVLIVKYFPLTKQELMEWRETPEQYYIQEDVQSISDRIKVFFFCFCLTKKYL